MGAGVSAARIEPCELRQPSRGIYSRAKPAACASVKGHTSLPRAHVAQRLPNARPANLQKFAAR
jgi:hypothetical protein